MSRDITVTFHDTRGRPVVWWYQALEEPLALLDAELLEVEETGQQEDE